MTTTVTVGGNPIISNAQITAPAAYAVPTATWATPSTAGTMLVMVAANPTGATIVTSPTGWVLATALTNSLATSRLEVWIYPNNPGGIQLATFGSSAVATWRSASSEWGNVSLTGAQDSHYGAAIAIAGTTLTPGGTLINTAGDLILAVWSQVIAAPAAVTFTSPGGYTQSSDGATSLSHHIDVEYLLNPLGPVIPVLTSDHTSTDAVGFVLFFKPLNPAVDHTNFLKYGSLGVKLNTADFTLTQGGRWLLETDAPGDNSGWRLEDGSGVWLIDTVVPSLGDPVTITNPAWSGRVTSVRRRDISELKTSNYREVDIEAINQAVATASPVAPGDFSDVAGTGGHWLLEADAGSDVSAWQLEDGSGYWLLEGTAFGYRHLQVQQGQNQDGSVTNYGSLETYEAGYAAGQAFTLTSKNLGYSAQPFSITNVIESWQGAAATGQPTILYAIEFGDVYQTLQKAGGGILTQQASAAVVQQGSAVPAGTLGYAQVMANQGTFTAATDLTGLSVTVTVAAGRRIKVTGQCVLSSSVTADGAAVTIVEGATTLQDANVQLGTTGQFGVMAIAIATLQPSAGVHTYKLQGQRIAGSGNITMLASATQPALIMVEDIGT